jgi:hypothetical protein
VRSSAPRVEAGEELAPAVPDRPSSPLAPNGAGGEPIKRGS